LERHALRIEIVLGDITLERSDVIVSSASPDHAGTEGVEGEIRRMAGEIVLADCRRCCSRVYPLGTPIGAAVATTGGTLRSRWVVHAHGPTHGAKDAAAELGRAYIEAMRLAEKLDAKVVALPAISAGRKGFPVTEVATIAMKAVRESGAKVETVRFVLHGRDAYRAFVEAFVSAL
jgi:O-acetyl-ADP-ribose deacetylase (regulator of RNase III)